MVDRPYKGGMSRTTATGPAALHLPNRRDLLRVLGLAGAGGLAGCAGEDGGAGGSPTGTEGGPLETSTPPASPENARREVRGTWFSADATDAESLFFIQTADAPSAARVGLTLDGAYAVTTEDEVFPLWVDIDSDDGRVYEVTVLDGLEWSDPYGQMTAEDWVYTIHNLFQGEDNWVGFSSPGEWHDDEGDPIPVEQTGEMTFEIRLPDVDPAYPLRPILWGQFCLPKGLLEKYVPDRDAEGLKQSEEIQTLSYTGNLGPYTFERWDREAEFVATRNPDYYMHGRTDLPEKWQGAPYFERYVIKVIPEESTRLAALRTGEITATGIPPSKVPQFEELNRINVIQSPQPFISQLTYNQRANGWPPFRERAVRRALSYVVNKRSIVDNILRGYAQVAHTFQPRWSKWFDDSLVMQSGVGEGYSHQRARELLAEALPSDYGYDGDTLVGPDNTQERLRLVYGQGAERTKTTAEFIAQEYGNVGIDVTLKPVQFNTLLAKYVRTTDAPPQEEAEWYSGPFNAGNRDEAVSEESWDLMTGIRFNAYPRTPTDTRGFWERQGDTNYFGYYPSVDMTELYDRAARSVDADERSAALAEIFGVLSEDQPANFISFDSSLTGYQNEVAGFGEIKFGWGWDSVTYYFAPQ